MTKGKVFFNDTATTEIYTLSLHDALPIYARPSRDAPSWVCVAQDTPANTDYLPSQTEDEGRGGGNGGERGEGEEEESRE